MWRLVRDQIIKRPRTAHEYIRRKRRRVETLDDDSSGTLPKELLYHHIIYHVGGQTLITMRSCSKAMLLRIDTLITERAPMNGYPLYPQFKELLFWAIKQTDLTVLPPRMTFRECQTIGIHPGMMESKLIPCPWNYGDPDLFEYYRVDVIKQILLNGTCYEEIKRARRESIQNKKAFTIFRKHVRT